MRNQCQASLRAAPSPGPPRLAPPARAAAPGGAAVPPDTPKSASGEEVWVRKQDDGHRGDAAWTAPRR
eukprot:10481187-Alexandrium_andersonii.AAC.1